MPRAHIPADVESPRARSAGNRVLLPGPQHLVMRVCKSAYRSAAKGGSNDEAEISGFVSPLLTSQKRQMSAIDP